ncbi:sensor histidine kinase [Chryseobacterium salivictor]|uniref:Nitrate/nitrite sensor protein NarX n=1 Tax=Chryseobacterium salivictor TaxID=2547600 RepID=A0A4P6ZCI6_9FLAO|nr:histidine kinase [Chryseobacterium salivictor]QBO57167.1 Nitrate/nitrite sensor protein NarX [Chryseobacterium salivictor]
MSKKKNELKEAEFKNLILQKEIEVQKEAQAEKQRISRDMHDDFGSGISALKLQIEFLKLSKHDGSIDANIEDLLTGCDHLNHSMREMLWSLNSSYDSLESFINYVTVYAVNFFKKTKIKPHIHNEGHQNIVLGTVIRRNLYLCVKEALNNIYKHSSAENVFLNFEQKENHFVLDVKDDGVGLSSNHSGGNGFANMESRMTAMKGQFKILPSEKGLHLQFILSLAE